MAYVARIYRGAAGDASDWVPNTDPEHAHFHQPVMRDPALAPVWAQVTGAVAGPAGPVATRTFRSGHPLP